MSLSIGWRSGSDDNVENGELGLCEAVPCSSEGKPGWREEGGRVWREGRESLNVHPAVWKDSVSKVGIFIDININQNDGNSFKLSPSLVFSPAPIPSPLHICSIPASSLTLPSPPHPLFPIIHLSLHLLLHICSIPLPLPFPHMPPTPYFPP